MLLARVVHWDFFGKICARLREIKKELTASAAIQGSFCNMVFGLGLSWCVSVSVVDLASCGSATKGVFPALSSPNISKKSTVRYVGSSLKLLQASWQGSGYPPAAPVVQPAPPAEANATKTPQLHEPFRSGKIL